MWSCGDNVFRLSPPTKSVRKVFRRFCVLITKGLCWRSRHYHSGWVPINDKLLRREFKIPSPSRSEAGGTGTWTTNRKRRKSFICTEIYLQLFHERLGGIYPFSAACHRCRILWLCYVIVYSSPLTLFSSSFLLDTPIKMKISQLRVGRRFMDTNFFFIVRIMGGKKRRRRNQKRRLCRKGYRTGFI